MFRAVGETMTMQAFKALEAGIVLLDDRYSRRKGRIETVVVIEHAKDGSGIVLRDDIGNSLYPYELYWNFDILPEDTSALPFY